MALLSALTGYPGPRKLPLCVDTIDDGDHQFFHFEHSRPLAESPIRGEYRVARSRGEPRQLHEDWDIRIVEDALQINPSAGVSEGLNYRIRLLGFDAHQATVRACPWPVGTCLRIHFLLGRIAGGGGRILRSPELDRMYHLGTLYGDPIPVLTCPEGTTYVLRLPRLGEGGDSAEPAGDP